MYFALKGSPTTWGPDSARFADFSLRPRRSHRRSGCGGGSNVIPHVCERSGITKRTISCSNIIARPPSHPSTLPSGTFSSRAYRQRTRGCTNRVGRSIPQLVPILELSVRSSARLSGSFVHTARLLPLFIRTPNNVCPKQPRFLLSRIQTLNNGATSTR